jgi:hypothetical protein
VRLALAAGLALACICAGLLSINKASGAAATGCFIKPSACGYPDATNTGVPAGTSLTPSGSRTVSTNGAVLNGLDITGTVTVAADNVTIKNSRITATRGGSGTYAVILNNGADNFTIEHTEVLGPTSETAGLQSAVWNHYGNPGVVARNVYFHKCADCWEGPGVFEDVFMVVDAAYNGSHDEDIYVCGAAVKVEHSTLFNTHHQTATVFGDTAGCGGNTIEIKNSLLAGGGYMLYPQGNASSPVGTMNIQNNRFARCRTGNVYNSSTGGTYCDSTSGDANGYYPYGGFYGVAAYYFTGGSNVWTNNVWDDNNQPVCPTGNAGCGVATPPPTSPPPTEEPPVEEPPVEEPPTEEPPVEEPPVEEPPVEEPSDGEGEGEGEGETPPPTPVEAVFSIPREVLAGVPTVLDGTGSTGSGSLSCRWSIRTPGGFDSLDGCLTQYSFDETGTSTVRLTVSSSLGGSDSSRRTVIVRQVEPVTPPPTKSTPSLPVPPTNGPRSESVPPTHAPAAEGAPSTTVNPTAPAPPTGTSATAGDAASSLGPVVVDAHKAWQAPALVAGNHRIRLVAVTDRSASCIWTVVTRSIHRDRTTRIGCSSSLQAPAVGRMLVRLTITSTDGTVSSARRKIVIAPRARVAG